MISLIDTFEDFRMCFQDNLDATIKEKIKIWEDCYISNFPELERKCKEDYESNGYDWREIAENIVFNKTKDDFNKMIQAHNNILKILDKINSKVEYIFNIDVDMNIVLYCGLCNSAGSVHSYNGKRTIFYGIDKIAELNWHTIDKLEPLLSHELCHVLHFELRGEDDLPQDIEKNNYNEGIWYLYEEGFAQFFQYKLLGKSVDSRGSQWLQKCRENKEQLKSLYLTALYDKEKGTKYFFCDWFQVLGISDTGYYLGAEFINVLSNKYNMKDMARLQFETIRKESMEFLRE